METTLIYFSVKAMSATYILYKVWMFIFSPKVYKFWDNQLRYMRMARIRLWKSRKKRMVEKARKARYRARLDKAEAWIAQAENDILKVGHEKKTETQPNPLDEYNEVIGKTKIVYLEDPEVARKTPTRSEPMKKEPIEEDKDINTDDVIDDFTPKKGLTESEKRELMSNDGCVPDPDFSRALTFEELDKWDMIISGSDELLERYVAEDSLDIQELQYEKCKRTRCCSLFPVYHGSAKDNLGTEKLIEAITETFITETDDIQSELCGYVFKVEYTERKKRLSYLRLYHGTLHLRDTLLLSKKEKIKITEMCIPSNGEIVPVDHACPGEIVILADDTLKLNDILGNEKLLPHKTRIDNPMPLLRTTVEPQKPEQREALLNALAEIADTDPLLHFDIDTVTHEIMLSFLGKVQLEVICSLLEEKYHVGVAMKEPSVIYLERPQKKASCTIHIEVPPNPFWASIGLTVTPLPVGSGTQYKSEVSLGYLNQSFQNAVMEGVRYGMEQGLYGWGVTDCQICFDYGVYYSPVSTPADFRFLAPVVLEQALKKAGTQLLEPYLSFTLFAPQEYLSRAYNDAPKYCAIIESTRLEKDEVIFKGEIPARCIGEYRNDLNFYTNGRSVCITELKGYQETSGEPVFQPRRPNSRLDKIRHMFQKIM